MNITYDWSDVIWNLIGVIAMIIIVAGLVKFIKADAELVRNESLVKAKHDFLDQINSESIYCGGPTEKVVVNDLYKAAKRARKDKSLSRDIRMDLDKAINQYENHA